MKVMDIRNLCFCELSSEMLDLVHGGRTQKVSAMIVQNVLDHLAKEADLLRK
jgi:hypothetical protein